MHRTTTSVRLPAALLLGLLLVSCGGGDGTGVDEDDEIASVTVSPSSATIDIGQSEPFAATVRNGRNEVVSVQVTWSSNPQGVVNVTLAGVVTGLTAGQTTVSASAGGRTGSAVVTVNDPTPPGSPSGVQAAAASNTSMNVTWTDNSTSEDEFRIERETVGAAAATAGASALVFTQVGTVGPNITSFQDTGLDPGAEYRYQVRACNQAGCSDPSNPTPGVPTFATLAIETMDLPDGVEDEPYEATVMAAGGDGTVAWSVSAGQLPPPLQIATATGVVSGTPSTPGEYPFTVQAQGAGQTVTRDFSITIEEQILPPVVTTVDLPSGVVGQAYDAALTADEGDGAFTWQQTGGVFPPGLLLAPDGTIGGDPTAAGSFGFTVEVTSAEMSAEANLSIDVFDALAVTTAVLPSGVLNTPYSQMLAASGGDGAYTWERVGGVLPDDLALAADGTISGTPGATGTFDFTVRVTSGDGQTAEAGLSITINDQIQPPQVTTTELADGGVGAVYAQTLQATDGDGDYEWAVTVGNLPDGLLLNESTGEITGMPTTAGTENITVQVTSAALTGTADLSITVHEALGVTTAALPDGIEGQAYDEMLASSGGNGEDTWTLESGDLPEGFDLAADGSIFGTPAAASPVAGAGGPEAVVGTSNFTVKVENTLGQSATQALSITINAVLEITTVSLPDGQINVAYGETVAATGGDGDNTWSVASGLPPGLSIDPNTGEIAGTPTATGTFNFTVQVSSGDGQSDDQALSITINGTPVEITTTVLPDGQVGTPYSHTLAATGGTGSYAWEHLSGDMLPATLTLDPNTGEISGTPETSGTFNFTVRVTSGGQMDDQALSLTINGSPLAIETTFLSGGHMGVAYADAITVSGGDGSYSFAVTAGGEPTGLDVDEDDGTITGTPTASGVFPLTVEVSSGGSSVSRTFFITISTKAPGAFNLFVHNVSGVIPSGAVQTALNAAAAKIEEAVTGDVPDIFTNSIPAGFCDDWAQEFNGVNIDDVDLLMDISPIDGPGMTLASAGGCLTTPRVDATFMTVLGFMTMDSADLGGLDATQLRAVILHEMMHVLGIGGAWDSGGHMLVTDLGTADPRYIGASGVTEYGNLGGGDPDVPVYGVGSVGDGSYGSHWRESTFDTELMTPFSEGAGVPSPLSTMTIGALVDLGWTVSLAAAEAYAIPSPAPPGAPPAEQGQLYDRIWDGPVGVIGADGTFLGVLERRE